MKLRATALLASGLWLAAAVQAAIPALPRIEAAVAEANAASGRVRPLLIEVSLRLAGGGPTAEGVLATHPTGLARLELKSPLGFVERHLLQGDVYAASRDGNLLDRPHPFLPPVFLLQSSSPAALGAALDSFGVSVGEVSLGYLGDHDCYVLGGRNVGSDALRPSLWVDTTTFEPVRIVRRDGTEYRLGPAQVFDGIRLPAWIEIRAPGSPRARLEVRGASKADAPAAAFKREWLEATPAAPQAPEGTPAPAPPQAGGIRTAP